MVRRSLILDTTVRLVFDAIVVYSVYLLFAGHNQPGGGFVGGLVAAAAISLRYLAGGAGDIDRLGLVRPWTLQAVGLALASGAVIAPLVTGAAPLDQRSFEWTIEVLGKVKLTTATVFDAGVYLIVVGLVLMIFEGLGDDSDDEDAGDEPAPAAPGRRP